MGQEQLLVMIGANSALAFLLGFGQSGQEHRSQNRDDGNHDQQLYECERPRHTLDSRCLVLTSALFHFLQLRLRPATRTSADSSLSRSNHYIESSQNVHDKSQQNPDPEFKLEAEFEHFDSGAVDVAAG